MVRFNVPISSILGYAYYRYDLSASNYNPSIDEDITITCKVTTVFGTNVSGKELILYDNDGSIGTATTDENGVATWENVTCADWGIIDFGVTDNDTSESVKSHCQVFVDGWRNVYGTPSSTFWISKNKTTAKLVLSGWARQYTINTNFADNQLGTQASTVKPRSYVTGINSQASAYFRVTSNGAIQVRSVSGTLPSGTEHYLEMEWDINSGV